MGVLTNVSLMSGFSRRAEPAAVESRPAAATLRPDGDLLPRVAAGDDRAMREVIERYGALIWSLARRLLVMPGEAEDAVQNAFLAIWRDAHRFDPDRGSELSFVATIARRRIIDRGRRAGRAATAERDDAFVAAQPTESVPRDPALQDEVRRVNAALAALPEQQRTVLELALHHGRSHQQIADELSIPLGTVKTHARRGLHRVRDALREGGAP